MKDEDVNREIAIRVMGWTVSDDEEGHIALRDKNGNPLEFHGQLRVFQWSGASQLWEPTKNRKQAVDAMERFCNENHVRAEIYTADGVVWGVTISPYKLRASIGHGEDTEFARAVCAAILEAEKQIRVDK